MATFALAVLAINLLLRRSVISPILQMADLAQEISADQVDESAPDRLDAVSTRTDELGQMARVFQRMAREVYAREQGLKQQLQALRIEIDETKKAKQVAELTGSDSFADLQARARKMRERHRGQASDTTQAGNAAPASDTTPGRQRHAVIAPDSAGTQPHIPRHAPRAKRSANGSCAIIHEHGSGFVDRLACGLAGAMRRALSTATP